MVPDIVGIDDCDRPDHAHPQTTDLVAQHPLRPAELQLAKALLEVIPRLVSYVARGALVLFRPGAEQDVALRIEPAELFQGYFSQSNFSGIGRQSALPSFFNQRLSQLNEVWCHCNEFLGLSTQWFSSGKTSSSEGTPRRCSAVNAARPCV